MLTNSEGLYSLTTMVGQALVREMAMAEEQAGRVAVYRVELETAKATLRLKAEIVLAAVSDLLRLHPEWRMVVKGHPDGVGEACAGGIPRAG